MSQWEALDIVQLKGALILRGLETDGTKEELLERIQTYEKENPEVPDANGEAMQVTEGAEETPKEEPAETAETEQVETPAEEVKDVSEPTQTVEASKCKN